MKTNCALILANVLVVAPAWSADELHLEVPAGLEVTLWAESPLLLNPTAMDVDEMGRVWVTEAVNYRKWGGRNTGLEHPEGDRVVVLSDEDGDGRCETSVVFAQGPELVSPLGILVLGEGRVLVSCSPSALIYVDEDGDGRADRYETFLTGFGGENHDHGLHSFTPGPSGQLYFAAGNAGPHLVTDKAGWRLRSGSIYVGGGQFTADNKPGLLSDDGRAWTGGLAMRIGSNGKGLGVVAHNFRNNYEVALDSFGNVFTSDNDDDGNRSCRTLWAMRGGNYGYFSEDGTRYWRADRKPGQSIQSAHWHQEDPGVSPAGDITGAGGPTGVAVYEGDLMSAWIPGAVLNADAGAGVVYAHQPKTVGAGIQLDAGWLLRGSDSQKESAQWFRPSDVCVATDGSVLVADWYDPGVGGHLAGDRKAYGRILRIAPKGAPKVPLSFDLSQPAGLLGAFLSPAPSVRAMAATRLFDGSEGNLTLVDELLKADVALRVRARLIYSLGRLGEKGVTRVVPYLDSSEADLRAVAIRVLGDLPASPQVLKWLLSKCDDPSPMVRLEVMTRLGAYAESDAFEEAMMLLAKGYDGEDRNYLEAFGAAARGHEERIFTLLSWEMGNTPSRWSPAFAGLAWRLHPVSAVGAFRDRASDVTLNMAARFQALDAIAFMPERRAGEAMSTLALTSEGQVAQRATWWLRHRDTNDWREYGLGVGLASGELGAAELVWESGLIRSGTKPIRVDLKGAKRIWLEASDSGDGNSCDWADWIDPQFLTASGAKSLTKLPWISAESGWGGVSVNANAVGQPMRCDGQAVSVGIGVHANSVLEYAVPEGAHAFIGSVGPDEGGTDQNGGAATSIEFRVYVERERDRTELLAQVAIMQDAELRSYEREDAVRALAMDPEGGLILIAEGRGNRLLPDVREVARDAIFNNPDMTVRTLASEVFQRSGVAASLPPILELLRLEGDARRGEEIYQGDAAACTTCHSLAGLGEDIGPDLTSIGTKYGHAGLMDAILNPSAGIAFGYDSWLLQVKGKGYFAGFILADGENVVLKDSKGARHVFARENILSRDRQSLSIMPQGVALGLGPQGIADLVAFLGENREAEPDFGEPVVLFDGSDLSQWDFHLSDEQASLEDVWSVEADGSLRCKGNPIGYISTKQLFTSFQLELDWRFDPAKGAGNSGVLLRMTGPDMVWPRSIEAQLHSRNAGDIWNIGEVPMLISAQRTSGRRTTKLAPSNEKPLGEWNHYKVTLDAGELRIEVNGVLQNEASWCEVRAGKICLQSEGAEIQFRNIVVRPILDR